jgi:hypothetical protein
MLCDRPCESGGYGTSTVGGSASVLVSRLSRRAVVAAGAPAGSAGVEADLDELARDAGVGEPVEGRLRQIGGEFDEREVRADLDRSEVASAEPALIREGPDDLARFTRSL